MEFSYKPTGGVCSRMMNITIEDDVVVGLEVINGCAGNLKGIASLVTGMKVDDVIAKLEGITCGRKLTSCPDQLSCALKAYKAGNF